MVVVDVLDRESAYSWESSEVTGRAVLSPGVRSNRGRVGREDIQGLVFVERSVYRGSYWTVLHVVMLFRVCQRDVTCDTVEMWC